MPKSLDINQVADILDVTPTTLRRWDANKTFLSRRVGVTTHRYYFIDDIENFLITNFKYLKKIAINWVFSTESPDNILSRFYCPDSSVFKARLTRLEKELQAVPGLKDNFSLVTSLVGEIGNNSFDHNIGNWPDLPGIFFVYDLAERKIILADRGRGVLATLRNVRASLSNDEDALKVAFTEVVSGRSLEARGNGLKYVKRIVMEYAMKLYFQSGKGEVDIGKEFAILGTKTDVKGCFVILDFKNL